MALGDSLFGYNDVKNTANNNYSSNDNSTKNTTSNNTIGNTGVSQEASAVLDVTVSAKSKRAQRRAFFQPNRDFMIFLTGPGS